MKKPRMKKPWLLLSALLLALGASPALAQADDPVVVEEESLFFDVTFGPQLGLLVPLGGGGVAPLAGFEATRYIGWPFYLGAAVYGGAQLGGATVPTVLGGAKTGLLIRLSGYAIEPGLTVGAAYQAAATATPVSPAVWPDLTGHLDLSEDFTLRVGAGYVYTPSLPGLSGPVVRVGMSF